jgi:hypothetical protein
MDKDNFFIKTQIESNIYDVENLLSTGVFNAAILRSFQEPVFVSIILKLDDLLQKLRILDERVNFTDDVASGDITDLVNNIRNAICHLNSPENMLDKENQIKFVFNIAVGKANIIQIGKTVVKSDYDDDTAFFYGENRIYLKRHIMRILKESRSIYQKLYPDA